MSIAAAFFTLALGGLAVFAVMGLIVRLLERAGVFKEDYRD